MGSAARTVVSWGAASEFPAVRVPPRHGPRVGPSVGPHNFSGVPMHRMSLLVVALVVGAAVLAGPASAQDQWTAPERLADDQAGIGQVSSSGSGDIFATFYANGVFDVSRRPGGNWVRGRDPVGGAGGIVVDDDGNVTVAYPADGYCPDGSGMDWGEDSEDFHIEAAFRPFGTQDWRRFRLPGAWDGCMQSFPELDVDARGTVTAVWSGDGSIYASQRRLGQRWTKPVVIGRCQGTEFDVVVTGRKATAVWTTEVMLPGSIRSAVTRTFGNWGKGRKVADIPGDPYGYGEHLSVISTGRGTLLAAWSDFVSRNREWYSRVRFATTDDRGRWRAPRTVDSIDVVPTRVRAVATAAYGSRAVLAWLMSDDEEAGGPLRVRVRTRGGWSSTKLLDRSANMLGSNGVAATEGGAALVWTGGDAGNYLPLARTRRWSGKWRSTELLSNRGPADLMKSRIPWVVTYKPDVFTAAFPRDDETWSSDLRLGAGG